MFTTFNQLKDDQKFTMPLSGMTLVKLGSKVFMNPKNGKCYKALTDFQVNTFFLGNRA
jgi:hypothetical protein